jgi:hypothetical protein
MTDKTIIICTDPAQSHKEISERLWPWLKAMLVAGHQITIEAKEDTRTKAQNRMMHDIVSEIAKHVEWYGKKMSVLKWKRLLMAAWLRSKGETPELIPALDGNGFDVIYEKTSELGVTRGADFITYLIWYADENGVVLPKVRV